VFVIGEGALQRRAFARTPSRVIDAQIATHVATRSRMPWPVPRMAATRYSIRGQRRRWRRGATAGCSRILMSRKATRVIAIASRSFPSGGAVGAPRG
jgi:hypothetical protein